MLIHAMAVTTVAVFGAAGVAAFTRHVWLLWVAGAAEVADQDA